MLKQAGLSGVELKRACKQVIAALSRMLKDDRGKWILADEHEEQRNELTVTGFYKHKLVTAIIDRTFIDQEGVRWIIDYKSSSHEGPDLELFLDREQQRYADQLDKYGGLMAALDPRPIKLGLYYPLLQGWREWDFEQR
jgi:ATP-dependent helicase/nuclease subunit A